MGAESSSAENSIAASGGIVNLTLQRLFQRIAEAAESATDVSSNGDRWVRARIHYSCTLCRLFDMLCLVLR